MCLLGGRLTSALLAGPIPYTVHSPVALEIASARPALAATRLLLAVRERCQQAGGSRAARRVTVSVGRPLQAPVGVAVKRPSGRSRKLTAASQGAGWARSPTPGSDRGLRRGTSCPEHPDHRGHSDDEAGRVDPGRHAPLRIEQADAQRHRSEPRPERDPGGRRCLARTLGSHRLPTQRHAPILLAVESLCQGAV